jgi:hypothetical protein
VSRVFDFSALQILSLVPGTLRQSSNDSFHAETNLCGICRDSRPRVSFTHFGGTAVSARQTDFVLGERDA